MKQLRTLLIAFGTASMVGACGNPEDAVELGYAEAALSCPCDITELPPDTGSGPAALSQELNSYILLPSNYPLGGVVLGGVNTVLTTGAVNVSSGMVMGSTSAVINIGASSSIAAIRSGGAIVIGDNVTRVSGSKLESGTTVSRGAGVSSANVTENLSDYFFNNPRGFYAKQPVGGASGVVPEGEEQAIAPGSYGYVRVGGSLRLRSGVYDFEQLNFYAGSRLKLDQANGPIVIHVGRPGMFPTVVDVVTGSGDPNLMMVYAGTGTLRVEAPINMFVLATNGQLRFAHAGPHKGSFWGKDLVVEGAATFTKRTLNLATFFPASKIFAGPTIVVEAENYSATIRSDVSSSDGLRDTWTSTSSASASGGTAMLHGLDDGHTWSNNINTRSPRLDYYVNFPTTGLHWVHLRADAPNSNGDTCHAGIDNVVHGTAYDFSDTPNTWGWLSKQAINVTTAGVHRITVWGREDGLKFDKIVIDQNATSPTGNGPTSQSPISAL